MSADSASGFDDAGRRQQREARRQDLLRRIERLNPRDREVMRMIYEEYPNKGIAAELDVSQRTIEGIRAKIFRTLGVATGIGLARLLAEHHYFSDTEESPGASGQDSTRGGD